MPYASREQRLANQRERHARIREQDNSRRKADYLANHEKEKAARRAWYEANREKALEAERARQYKIRYGISVEEYAAFLTKQGGRCAICGSDSPNKSNKPDGARYKHRYFAIDHDHETGRVRGLLCAGCNVGLGRVESWYLPNQAAIDSYILRGKSESEAA